jgi:hypothetical protein
VARSGAGLEVLFEDAGGSHRATYDHVVNALWDGRLAVDASFGIKPPRAWLYRARYNLRFEGAPLPASLPCVTIALGAFGDIVTYANGAGSLSWYPVGMVGTSSALTPPAWPTTAAPDAATRIRDGIIAGLGAIVPAIAQARAALARAGTVKGGAIFAWGRSDIDDADSGLHSRHDVGVETHGCYHSINTGKLTTAPLFARQLAERIGCAA